MGKRGRKEVEQWTHLFRKIRNCLFWLLVGIDSVKYLYDKHCPDTDSKEKELEFVTDLFEICTFVM